MPSGFFCSFLKVLIICVFRIPGIFRHKKVDIFLHFFASKICRYRKKQYLCNVFKTRAFSSAGSEHLPYKQRVGGSNPSTPTKQRELQFATLFLCPYGFSGTPPLPLFIIRLPLYYDIKIRPAGSLLTGRSLF